MDQQPDYSFIMQNGGKNRPQLFAPKTQKQRIILVSFIAGSFILIALIVMILVNIFSVDTSKKLRDLAVYQAEMQRVMDIGVKDSRDLEIKNLAQTVSSTLSTHSQNTIKLASRKNVDITPKQILAGKVAKTDERLETAKNLGKFDAEFKIIYEEQLSKYNQLIDELSSISQDREIRSLLSSYLNNNSLISLKYEAKNTD